MIRNNKYEKKLKRKQRHKEFWFKITKLKKIRNVIRKYLYELELMTGCQQEQIRIKPIDFKKFSLSEIEFGLSLLKKYNELIDWKCENVKNSEEYILTIPVENRLESRILDHMVLKETIIETNSVKNEVKSTSDEQISDNIVSDDELLDF